MKTLLEIIGIVIVLSILMNIVTTRQTFAKATAFCDREVVIGQARADLLKKSKQAGAKFYFSGSTLNIYFTGSFRPAICKITLLNNLIIAKQVEMAD